MGKERPETKPGSWHIPTRDLLTCAAIGVVSGLAMLPAVYLQVSVTAAMPLLYTIFTGTFILGPVLAQALVRRPGSAFIAAIVAALANAPFSPRGILAILPMAIVGGVYEITALTGRYRTWPQWRWYLASLLMSVFSMVTITIAFDLLSLQPLIAAASIGAIPVSYLLGTWLSIFIADKLRRAGVGFTSVPEESRLGYVSDDPEPNIGSTSGTGS